LRSAATLLSQRGDVGGLDRWDSNFSGCRYLSRHYSLKVARVPVLQKFGEGSGISNPSTESRLRPEFRTLQGRLE